MSKILVFGASGFSGSKFVEYVVENTDYEVIPITKDSNLNGGSFDISCYQDVENVLVKFQPDYIINFAGSYTNNFDIDYKVNFLGPKNILDAITNNSLNNIKILLVGSSGEYATNETTPIIEESPLCPSSFYTLTKVFQTDLLKLYTSLYNINACLVRPSNLIGPNMSTKLFIGNFFKQLLDKTRTEKIIVKNESSYRDFIDIRDAVRGYFDLLKNGVSGEIYNLGSGNATQIKEIIDFSIKIMGIPRNRIEVIDIDNESKVDYQLLNTSKIRSLVGFRAKFKVQDSIKFIIHSMNR